MTKIGDTKTHLNWTWYQYRVWDSTWLTTAVQQHPDETDVESRSSKANLDRPELLYSDSDLLMAIHAADSLDDLEKTLRKNREHIDKPEEWHDE